MVERRSSVGGDAEATGTRRTQLTRLPVLAASAGKRHRLQVLDDGCKVELVAGAGQASEPRPPEAMVGLPMHKSHIDALSFVARFQKRLGRHDVALGITSILVDIAYYAALHLAGAALVH